MVWCILLMRIGFEFWYLWYCVFDLTMYWVLFVLFIYFLDQVFWVLLVDFVVVSEFNYGFVYVFACLDAKKMQEKRRKS